MSVERVLKKLREKSVSRASQSGMFGNLCMDAIGSLRKASSIAQQIGDNKVANTISDIINEIRDLEIE